MAKSRNELSPTRQPRFPSAIYLRCPASLPHAVDLAAQKNFMTSAEYMRRSILDRIKADGIDPAQSAGAAEWLKKCQSLDLWLDKMRLVA